MLAYTVGYRCLLHQLPSRQSKAFIETSKWWTGCTPCCGRRSRARGNPHIFNMADSAKDEIKHQMDLFSVYFESGDMEKAVSLYASDAVMMPPGQPQVVGKEAIYKAEIRFRDVDKMKTLNYSVTEVDVLSDDAAFTTGICTPQDADGKEVARFKDLVVWRKKNDKWVIVRDMYNDCTG